MRRATSRPISHDEPLPAARAGPLAVPTVRLAALASVLLLAACDTVGVDPPPTADAVSWPEMLAAVNEARAEGQHCGGAFYAPAGPLAWSVRLETAAGRHSRDMEAHAYFSHVGTDGSRVGDRTREAGYRWRLVAENIAQGHRSVDEVVTAWLASPGHCRQIMDPRLVEVGAAESGRYWTQVFALPG